MWTVVDPAIVIWCFSPVAGIQWVETLAGLEEIARNLTKCFSPVAGIQWVETPGKAAYWQARRPFQSRCRDSVG